MKRLFQRLVSPSLRLRLKLILRFLGDVRSGRSYRIVWSRKPDKSQSLEFEPRVKVVQVLKAVMGGGSCQLSGILYYLMLQAGLEAIERFPHSADIYTDETRFTLLGSDATVVIALKLRPYDRP